MHNFRRAVVNSRPYTRTARVPFQSMAEHGITWRAKRASVFCAGLIAIGLAAGVGIDMLVNQDGDVVDVVGPLVLAAVLFWRFALHPSLSVGSGFVIVRNPLGTRRLPLTDVTGVEPGYGGICFTMVSGRPAVAWAVQKSNLAVWFGKKPTRADRVVEAIRDRVPRAG